MPIRRRVIAPPCGESMTKQSFKDDCDFNLLLRKFGVTSGLPAADPSGGLYVDMTSVPSAQQAHQMLLDASAQFSSLPADVRRKYPTPAALMAALKDPLEQSTLATLGVISPRQPSQAASSSVQDETVGTEPTKPSKKAKSSPPSEDT